MADVQVITVDPAHFHAALVQKEMAPGIARQVHVYAPLGGDLLAHLQRIAGFNSRPQSPTAWELEVHAGPDFLERFQRERPGQVVVLAGRNRRKIDYIEAAVAAGLHVLADKPWIIVPENLPRLQAVLDQAETRRLVAYDIMTERYEITSILQRTLVQDREVFGEPLPGDTERPGVYMESIHYLKKLVAGVPLRRPAWFFDIAQQGEGLSDVGTHLVDLVMWVLFPEQPIAVEAVSIVAGKRWPTLLTRTDFQDITGEGGFPDYLSPCLKQDRLEYFCNNQVSYTLRGIHVKLDVLWGLEAEPGTGDSHHAVFLGSRSRVEIRQGKEQQFRTELYIVPQSSNERAAISRALASRVGKLQDSYPGVAIAEQGERLWVQIPERYRIGHEAHFGEVVRHFLQFLQSPASLPAWEKPFMMAKYHVTTRGVR